MMKIKKLIGALGLSLALFVGGGTDWVSAQQNNLVQEDDPYDSSFQGPLPFCVRKDSPLALASDGQTMPFLCDDEGSLITSAT